jgi:hypothetical protein
MLTYLNFVWIIPLYSFLVYEIIRTIYAIYKNILQIYDSIGIVMFVLPSFYVWSGCYTISIIAPIYAMIMVWGFTLTENDIDIKNKVKYALSIILALFILNTFLNIIEPYCYPLIVDSQGHERVRLLPFVPPIRH